MAPNRTRNLTSRRVVHLTPGLQLANSGERLTLERGSTQVDSVRYTDAPEGERGRATARGLQWQSVGATNFPVVSGSGGQVRAFVLPDGSDVPAETIGTADDRIRLAGYTLTAQRIVDRLSNAANRGVDVQVLVDSSPVGGLTRREATALDRLVAEGVTVTVLGGDRARYEFHHAKYAVVDDRALVTTENWKAAGTGGHASRGWGVVVSDPRVVTGLAETFRADATWRDALPWPDYRQGRTFEPPQAPPANQTYPSRFDSRRVTAERIELLRAPDNAERRLVALIDNASESVRVEQMSIGGRRQPFLQAALRAARRGVRVRILLSSAWYVAEDNRRLIQWLNDRAAQENIPLKARMAAPRGRFEKIHAKGVVIDDEQVLVGSLNWNNHSARQNREVMLLLEGADVAEYYAAVFDADWQGGDWTLPLGLIGTLVVGLFVAVLLGRRIQFEAGDDARAGLGSGREV
nr:phospholipase D-like domain-containing protein [Halorientalis brevis]